MLTCMMRNSTAGVTRLVLVALAFVSMATACGTPEDPLPEQEPLSTIVEPIDSETGKIARRDCENEPGSRGEEGKTPTAPSYERTPSGNSAERECGEPPEDLTKDEMRSASPAPMPVQP
jgi:hypothetical protein